MFLLLADVSPEVRDIRLALVLVVIVLILTLGVCGFGFVAFVRWGKKDSQKRRIVQQIEEED